MTDNTLSTMERLETRGRGRVGGGGQGRRIWVGEGKPGSENIGSINN